MPIHDFKNIDDASDEIDKGIAKEITKKPSKKFDNIKPSSKLTETKKKPEKAKEKPKEVKPKKKFIASDPQVHGNLEIDEIEL